MILSVPNDGIAWFLELGPDSVTLTLKDLVQVMTISSQELLPAALSLLLSQRQNILNKHLARVPITSNQERTMETRDEVLSSVGAQENNTSGYQLSDIKAIDFIWERDQLDVDAVFRSGYDTYFSPRALDNLEMGGSAEASFCSSKNVQAEIYSNNTSL